MRPSEDRMTYCRCESARDWYGIANIAITAAENDEEHKWLLIARRYAGLVICQNCAGIAPWRGEPVGQMTLTGAAHVLRGAL